MNIKRVPVDQINPAPYNPRVDLQPGDPQYEALLRSVEEFGCIEPLVWNSRSGNLVGGHQRLKVLVAAGAAEVEVSVVDLPPEREKALNVALNSVSGDWDAAKLDDLLSELKGLAADDAELEALIEGLGFGELEKLLPDTAVPADNRDIDEEAMAQTEHECPKCGFKW